VTVILEKLEAGAATPPSKVLIHLGRYQNRFLKKYPMADNFKALVFPVITNLQKLANHLALLIPNNKDPPDKQERDLEFLKKMVPDRWRELYANRESLFNLSNPEFCGKARYSPSPS
jgi:hypothetical protein